jgi:hypothetical protein
MNPDREKTPKRQNAKDRQNATRLKIGVLAALAVWRFLSYIIFHPLLTEKLFSCM